MGLRGVDLQRYGNAGPLASGELDEAGGRPLAKDESWSHACMHEFVLRAPAC